MKPGLSRIRSARQGCSPERSLEGFFRLPVSLFRIVFHGFICTAALLLGFRLSREAVLVVVSFKQPETSLDSSTISALNRGDRISGSELALQFPYVSVPGEGAGFPAPFSPPLGGKSSRVHVGRHEILIRPWPHPDALQTIRAHRLIDLVQHEQRRSYSAVKERRRFLVITPTYVRTFQALHLMSLMHTLKSVPDPLLWIVIEAGGASNETSVLLSNSDLPFVHLTFGEVMPANWEERWQVEARMRIEGLRFVRKHRLDGIVIFADDSNTHHMEFFEEAQKTKWIGLLSVGLLPHSDLPLIPQGQLERYQAGFVRDSGATQPLSILGPVCNSTGQLTGWFNPMLYRTQSSIRNTSNRRFQWAGFVLNAQLLWEDAEKPTWVRNWEEWITQNGEDVETPLDMVKDEAQVEALGNCGRDVWLWWLRVEARVDSKYPSRWVIDPPLEITVPSKHTPWLNLPVANPPPPIYQSGKHRGKQPGRGPKGRRVSRSAVKRKQVIADGNKLNQQAIHILGERTSTQE